MRVLSVRACLCDSPGILIRSGVPFTQQPAGGAPATHTTTHAHTVTHTCTLLYQPVLGSINIHDEGAAPAELLSCRAAEQLGPPTTPCRPAARKQEKTPERPWRSRGRAWKPRLRSCTARLVRWPRWRRMRSQPPRTARRGAAPRRRASSRDRSGHSFSSACCSSGRRSPGRNTGRPSPWR